jgi:hypothetical protein
MSVGHSSDVLHDDFRSFGLAGSTLARYHDARVLVLLAQNTICSIGYGIDMRRILEKFPSFVFVDELIAIDVHCPIRVDRDSDFTDVGVNFACLVSGKGGRKP